MNQTQHTAQPAGFGQGVPPLGHFSLFQPLHGGWPMAVALIMGQMIFCYDRHPQQVPVVTDASLQIQPTSPDDALQALAYLCAMPASGPQWYETSDTHLTPRGSVTVYLRHDN